MRVQGQAPSAVCVQVRDAVGYWCEKIHSTHGTWPTFNEAAEKTRQEFASRGHQLHLTQTVGENGGFTLEYPQFWEEIGKPVESGEPVVTRSDILEQDVPPSILARSRAGEKGVLTEN